MYGLVRVRVVAKTRELVVLSDKWNAKIYCLSRACSRLKILGIPWFLELSDQPIKRTTASWKGVKKVINNNCREINMNWLRNVQMKGIERIQWKMGKQSNQRINNSKDRNGNLLGNQLFQIGNLMLCRALRNSTRQRNIFKGNIRIWTI